MSIYELMLEEDHADLYNLLLNPPTVIDPVQESLSADNQVCFRCHLKREGQNYQDVVAYENVQFTGYFRELNFINKNVFNFTLTNTYRFISRHGSQI